MTKRPPPRPSKDDLREMTLDQLDRHTRSLRAELRWREGGPAQKAVTKLLEVAIKVRAVRLPEDSSHSRGPSRFTPDLGVVVCNHVRDNLRPILLITRYDDGDWVFTCGSADHADNDSEYTLVGVGHLTGRDMTLDGIADLAQGYSAERVSIGGPWTRFPDPA